ncbi:interleukin-12 receptor subunit beta-1 [Ascaphus truei]|uniref:interleukin-12 receptor subunit beta-1 n=1 Tax=Ascaphus truei TaxID=8439 RepID=UPI003F59FA7C
MRMITALLLLISTNLLRGAATSNEVTPRENWITTTGVTEKIPTDLSCYLNYTFEHNFCYCSWEAGKDSQGATYVLKYCNHRLEPQCCSFHAGIQNHFAIEEDDVYMWENISFWVEASEMGQVYRSKNITVLLSKAVKFGPPELNNIQFITQVRSLRIKWHRLECLPDTKPFLKEAQCRTGSRSLWNEKPCGLHEKDDSSSCVLDQNDDTTCIETCTLTLERDYAYYIQIRQKCADGIWSEWSDTVFAPADIVASPEIDYSVGKLHHSEMRNLSLQWKDAREEQGSVTYELSLTFLPCAGERLYHSTIANTSSFELSGAAYNLTIVASNLAGRGRPWSCVIEQDRTGFPFVNVRCAGTNTLRVQWTEETSRRANYCIEWKPTAAKEDSSQSTTINNFSRQEADIPTEDFRPMECYRITAHRFGKTWSTLGTGYYFKPSLSIGPGNLTMRNITAHSVLLMWDGFDLNECQGLLQTWVIITTDHEKNVSRESYENASVTQHLVRNLSLESRYTFNIKGITSFGEQTGSSQKSVITPRTDESIAVWLLLIICVGILLGFMAIGGLSCFGIKKLTLSLCPVLPDPCHSSATKFFSTEMKYIQSPISLIGPDSENGPEESLIVEPRTKTDISVAIVKETITTHWALTEERSEQVLGLISEVEADSQFEYRRQMHPTSPGSDKDSKGQEFFVRFKDGTVGQAEDPTENESLTCSNVSAPV